MQSQGANNSNNQEELVLLEDTCPSNGSLELLESGPTPSATTPYSGVVLATLDGPVMDYSRPTRNERLYEEELCDAIHDSNYVKELVETKNFLGEPDHPMRYENRLDIHYPYVSHAIRNFRKVPEKGCYYATFDILDTPNGRILKTLIDYGVKLGVSSRGSGRTINKLGRVVVDASTYRFITFDIVCMPGNKIARLPSSNESVDTNHQLSLSEQVNYYIDHDDLDSLRSIKPVLNFLSEDAEVKSLFEKVDDKIDSLESSTNAKMSVDDLLNAYSQISDLKSDIRAKDSIIKSQNEELNDLRSKLSNSSDTISGLNQKINELSNSLRTQVKTDKDSEKEMNKSKSVIDKLKKENDRLQESSDSYKRMYIQSQAGYKDLQESINQVRSDSSSQIKSLNENLDRANTDMDSMSEQLKFSNSRYNDLINQYFSVRCSQLGLNESLIKKSIIGSIDSYDVSEIENVLKEAYSNKPKVSSQSLFESLTSSGSRVSGSVRMNVANPSSLIRDDELSGLTASCREVSKQ